MSVDVLRYPDKICPFCSERKSKYYDYGKFRRKGIEELRFENGKKVMLCHTCGAKWKS